MGRRSHRQHAWHQTWHRHGLAIAVCLIVVVAMVIMGLIIWFMSDIRFRAR